MVKGKTKKKEGGEGGGRGRLEEEEGMQGKGLSSLRHSVKWMRVNEKQKGERERREGGTENDN